MPERGYTVNEGKSGDKTKNFDNSFISCMFAIFLFILLCVVLLIVMFAVKWNKDSDEIVTDTTKTYDDDDGRFERLKLNRTTTSRRPSSSTKRTTILEEETTEPVSSTQRKEVIASSEFSDGEEKLSTTEYVTEFTLGGVVLKEEEGNSTTEYITENTGPTVTTSAGAVVEGGDDGSTTEPVTEQTESSVSTSGEAVVKDGKDDSITELVTEYTEPSVTTSGGLELKEEEDSSTTEYITEKTEFTVTSSAGVVVEDEKGGSTTEYATGETEPSVSTSGGVVVEFDSTTDIATEKTEPSVSASGEAVLEDKKDGSTTEYITETTEPSASTSDGTVVIEGGETSTMNYVTEITDSSETYSRITTPEMTTMPREPAEGTCDSLECKRLAGRMLAQMGHEFNPCDNFYMYACGGVHSDPFLLPYDYTKDVRDRIHRTIQKERHSSTAFEKFSNFFNSCLNVPDIQDLENQLAEELVILLKNIGDFNDIRKKEDVNFTRFFTEIISLHRPLLFDIIVDVDDRNSNRYILKMTTPIHDNPFLIGGDVPAVCTPGTGIPIVPNLNEVYDNVTSCTIEKKIESLKESFGRILNVLKTVDGYGTTEHDLDPVEDLVIWMSKFSKVTPTESERRHMVLTKSYKLVNVSELNSLYPVIEWKTLLESLLNETVTEDRKVQLYSPDYFKTIFDMFQDDSNARNIQSALLAAFLGQLYRDLVDNFNQHDEYCLIVSSKLMEDVAAGAYLQSFNKSQLDLKMSAADKIFTQLKVTLRQHLKEAHWLEADKETVLKKLDKMTLAANGGVTVYTREWLEEHLKNVDLHPYIYVNNTMKLLRRYRSNIYKSYRSNPRNPENIWSHLSLPQETRGISIFTLNTIAIPYAVLAAPFFDEHYPEYLQLAGLGHVIAHEMAHHFDNTGMKFSSTGEYEPLLHHPASTLYKNMETCFEEEFNKTTTQKAEDGKIFTFRLDPKLNREEQLADDIATALVYSLFEGQDYDIYEKQVPYLGLNNKQSFFLHLAQGFCSNQKLQSNVISLFEDSHLPSLLRVNHFISQSKDFFEIFNCSLGSQMYPEHRCEVFPALSRTEIPVA